MLNGSKSQSHHKTDLFQRMFRWTHTDFHSSLTDRRRHGIQSEATIQLHHARNRQRPPVNAVFQSRSEHPMTNNLEQLSRQLCR